MSEYDAWEDEVTCILEERGEMSRSDAQGRVMASVFVMAQSWGLGLSAEDTANKLLAS